MHVKQYQWYIWVETSYQFTRLTFFNWLLHASAARFNVIMLYDKHTLVMGVFTMLRARTCTVLVYTPFQSQASEPFQWQRRNQLTLVSELSLLMISWIESAPRLTSSDLHSHNVCDASPAQTELLLVYEIVATKHF